MAPMLQEQQEPPVQFPGVSPYRVRNQIIQRIEPNNEGDFPGRDEPEEFPRVISKWVFVE